MEDEVLRELAASEPISLEEEYAVQGYAANHSSYRYFPV